MLYNKTIRIMEFNNWEITKDGLEISCTTQQSEELAELVIEKGILEAESEVLEHVRCNGLTEVLPEEIGGLTEATILSDGENYYSDFNYYQIRSFVEYLIDSQFLLLHKL